MKTAYERAIDILWKHSAPTITRSAFCAIVNDDSETGRQVAKLAASIADGIEEDRKYQASLRAPS